MKSTNTYSLNGNEVAEDDLMRAIKELTDPTLCSLFESVCKVTGKVPSTAAQIALRIKIEETLHEMKEQFPERILVSSLSNQLTDFDENG
ncbi:MAG: hypothetical protein PHI18_08895 [bacterium]|nr:hypothetical protein [bacterium]